MTRIVVDTVVLIDCDGKIVEGAGSAAIALLERIRNGKCIVMISQKLMSEYKAKLPRPRTEVVRLFLELLTAGGTNVTVNWARLGDVKAVVNHCRFPWHDRHLMQTAWSCDRNVAHGCIVSTDAYVLKSARCIKLHAQLEVCSV